MKFLTNKKIDKIANQIIELQRAINDEKNEIETNNYIKIVDLLSDIATECLDLPALMYVYENIRGEKRWVKN